MEATSMGLSPYNPENDNNAGSKNEVRFIWNFFKNICQQLKQIAECYKRANLKTLFLKTYRNMNTFRDKNSVDIKYRKGDIFSQPESDGTISGKCIEFKYFCNCVKESKENVLIKFLSEVLPFACGCLNKRQDGTIFFGVADSLLKKNDFEYYKHGEIVGFLIDEDGLNCKFKYTDALRDGISKYFHPSVARIALECISNPIFIEVLNSEGENYYVMKVDIKPFSYFCENLYFKINSNIGKKNKKQDYSIFVREGSSTKKLENKRAEQKFIKNMLPKYVNHRKSFEEKKLFKTFPIFFIHYPIFSIVLLVFCKNQFTCPSWYHF